MGVSFSLDKYNSLPSIIDIKSTVKEILLICEKLTSKDNEDYRSKKISNSDEGTIEILKYPKYKAEVYKIKLIKLACCQENLGSRLYSEELNMLDDGNYIFTVAKGEDTRNISIKVEAEDTNNKVLTKIIEALEKEDIGIEACIESYNRYIDKLLLRSKDKGSTNSFRIFDKSGSLVAYTGMWNEFIKAEDSLIIVNNESYKSISDTFEIYEGEFVFRVKKISRKEIEVKIDWDIELILKRFFQFIEALNFLVEKLKKEEIYKETLDIFISSLYEMEKVLNPIGIIITNDLKIRIIESQLKNFFKNASIFIESLISKTPNALNGLIEFCRSILEDKILLYKLNEEKSNENLSLARIYNQKGNIVCRNYTVGRNYDNFS